VREEDSNECSDEDSEDNYNYDEVNEENVAMGGFLLEY
jgi:hypothetical protein